MVTRSFAVGIAALASLVLFATPASAQAGYGPSGTITAQIDDTTLEVGQLLDRKSVV